MRWIDVMGDRWDIYCVHSRVRVPLCACQHCEPIRHSARFSPHT